MSRESDPLRDARHLRALLWGKEEGPRTYLDLPGDLRAAARVVDRIGDDLTQARLTLFQETEDPDDLIMQVQMVAHVLARQVLPDNLDDIPDPQAVWTRADLEGDAYDRLSMDTALHFLALGGEPNSWREGEHPVGSPSMKDIRAMQFLCADLTDVVRGVEEAGVTPSGLIEDFVRMHWSNNPATWGLRDYWEDTPIGHAIFSAIRKSRNIPAEQAAFVDRNPPDSGTRHPWGQGA